MMVPKREILQRERKRDEGVYIGLCLVRLFIYVGLKLNTRHGHAYTSFEFSIAPFFVSD